MDRQYLIDIIRRIESEKEIHATKFADNLVHADCLPRFESVLNSLRKELAKFTNESESNAEAGSED